MPSLVRAIAASSPLRRTPRDVPGSALAPVGSGMTKSTHGLCPLLLSGARSRTRAKYSSAPRWSPTRSSISAASAKKVMPVSMSNQSPLWRSASTKALAVPVASPCSEATRARDHATYAFEMASPCRTASDAASSSDPGPPSAVAQHVGKERQHDAASRADWRHQ
jgi:hypothetical protein